MVFSDDARAIDVADSASIHGLIVWDGQGKFCQNMSYYSELKKAQVEYSSDCC